MAAASASDRVSIDVSEDPLAVVTQTWETLKHAHDERGYPRALVREGGALVRITDAGFEAYTKDSLLGQLMRVAVFYKRTRSGESYVDSPPNVRTELLNRLDHEYGEDALRVKRFTSTPWFDAAGNLIQTPGLHEESGTFYRPAPELEGMPPVPAEPSAADGQAALHTIERAFDGFEFADQASRANAYGQMLTPFVKEMVGKVPSAAYIAPHDAINTGKTMAAVTAYYPALGAIEVRAGDTDDTEMRKEILAVALSGTSAFVVDNIKTRLDSGALAAAQTAPRWSGRILGQSKNWAGELDFIFAFTGNGLRMTPEIARRTSPIYLSPGSTGRGWERTFTRYDLDAWLHEHRAEMVWACLTLIQHWVAMSRDEGAPTGPTVHSYGRWSRTVGGVLQAAGIDGFMENHRAFIEDMLQDEGEDELGDFFAAWYALGTGPIRARELEELLRFNGALHGEAPAEFRALRDGQLATYLPTWLRSHKDKIAGRYALRKMMIGRHGKWFVDQVQA